MYNRKLTAILIIVNILVLCLAHYALAATPSGTNIQNYAKLLSFDGNFSEDSNVVNKSVTTIRGLDINDNSPATILPGGTLYFPKNLTNVGNIAENVDVALSAISPSWSVQLIKDDNNDGVRQAGETTPVPANINVPAGSIYKFFVAMTAPNISGSTGTVNLTCSANNVSLGSYTGNNNITYGGPALVATLQTGNTSQGVGNPTFSDITFDGAPMADRDYIGKSPLIIAKILDVDSIATASIKLTIDGVQITAGITFDGTYMSYQVTTQLSNGDHTFEFEAKDLIGNTGTRTLIGRITTKAKIVGRVLPYPNPYDPNEGDAKITYQLTNQAKVRIYIYNIMGERIKKFEIDEGEEGGHEGYNEVLWNGKNGFFEQVGNGVYIVHIVDSKGRTLAKTKILVIR
ncbi:T9SS type A sorting domain-containing protein [Candidatus Margulisiibacteriota bacterium]